MTYKMTDLAAADRRRWLRRMQRDLALREAFGPNGALRRGLGWKVLLAAALATAALSAQAKDLWVSPTTAGGEIVLTPDRVSGCGESLYWMYIVTADNEMLSGCWALVNDKVMVRFDSGDRRVYEPAGFTKRKVR